jgi:hypothetical protein
VGVGTLRATGREDHQFARERVFAQFRHGGAGYVGHGEAAALA